jgi:hypothetical protein
MPKVRLLLAIVALFHACALHLAAAEAVWISALDLGKAEQGWGAPGIDHSVEGRNLRIAGTRYERGYGTHAPAELDIALRLGSVRFIAQVGIDDEDGAIGGKGSVEFSVAGDGRTLWQSGIMRGNQPAKTIDIDVSGVSLLVLAVSDGGDGNGCDHADWANAHLIVQGQQPEATAIEPHQHWSLGEGMTTIWKVADDPHPEHGDILEQGGKRAGQVISYDITAQRTCTITRSVIWPCLRIIPNNTHGSLIHRYGAEAEPAITIDGKELGPLRISSIILDGTLCLHAIMADGIDIIRRTFPSTDQRAVFDRWTIRNARATPVSVAATCPSLRDEVRGPFGVNVMQVSGDALPSTQLAPGGEASLTVTFAARLASDAQETYDPSVEEAKRHALVASLAQELRLDTPDALLDRTFAMAKIRVAESINATRGGLMLAPGGLSYYAATWCNDNVEYAGPFFPFLGDDGGNQASLDTYRSYVAFMKADFHAIPSSIVAEGTATWHGAGDRGDAAMYAYGCSRFCLARGDLAISTELWPAISWCLEYCKRQTRPDGSISSDTDELEGRFPTGNANLSTICLYYGGLRSAADLARAIGKPADAANCDQQADAVAQSIERAFGATVQGFETYRYFEGNDILRSWICLPLCMGLDARREATVAALFSSHLWTDDGLATQAGGTIFWDRSTLYGLRGAFQAGATEKALRFLTAYSQRRLLGDHVPYPIETGKRGSQLASESALYCRIFVEGLFGIKPTGLKRFSCTPRLPDGWPRMALRSARAFGQVWDLTVVRRNAQLVLTLAATGHEAIERAIAPGGTAEITLP